MSIAQQAGLRCSEPDFARFLNETLGAQNGWPPVDDAEKAASVVRHICRIESRAELATNEEAAERWLRLDGDYWAWQRGFAA